jgi:hypothetical protein
MNDATVIMHKALSQGGDAESAYGDEDYEEDDDDNGEYYDTAFKEHRLVMSGDNIVQKSKGSKIGFQGSHSPFMDMSSSGG